MPGRTRQHARTTVAVLLAAGAGTRFADPLSGGDADRGPHKLDALLNSTSTDVAMTVFERSIGTLVRAHVGPIVVVTGGWEPSDRVREQLGQIPEITTIENDSWMHGQVTSVRAGLSAASELGAERVVVGLADQPFIAAEAWRSVARAPGAIVVATYGGRRANPVALDRAVWSLLPTEGDEGARSIMRIRPDLVREVACPGSAHDIDTTEDLRRWQNN